MRRKINKVLYSTIFVLFFSMTQGCITTESFGSGRGAAAKHKGIWKHEHKISINSNSSIKSGGFNNEIYEPIVIENEISEASLTVSESYIVKKGDILSQIALDFNSTTAELVEMNNLSDPDTLYVGQELQVPVINKNKLILEKSESISSIPKGGTYEIQKGDTLSEIAVAAGVSIDDLRSLNRIQQDRIYAGQKLDIPAYGNVPDIKLTNSDELDIPAIGELSSLDVDLEADELSQPISAVIEIVVYAGETLDDIALENGVSKSAIRESNPQLLDIEDDQLESLVGQKLRIPISE